MKKILIVLGLLFAYSISAQSQNIDNKNYYSFYKDGDGINWLRSCDVVPIIIDEFLKNGIPYHTIKIGSLLKVNDSTSFVVTLSFKKNDKDYGFLYETDHGIPLSRNDRDFMIDRKQAYFVQA